MYSFDGIICMAKAPESCYPPGHLPNFTANEGGSYIIHKLNCACVMHFLVWLDISYNIKIYIYIYRKRTTTTLIIYKLYNHIYILLNLLILILQDIYMGKGNKMEISLRALKDKLFPYCNFLSTSVPFLNNVCC